MNTWFTSNLGDAMLADEPLNHIKTLFFSEYGNPAHLKKSAAFIRHESEGRLHCEVKVYFSPEAVVIAKVVGAIPCDKPSLKGLDLLAGSEDSWSIFFPENSG